MGTKSTQSFEDVIASMREVGMKIPSDKIYISVPNAREVLRDALTYFLGIEGKELIWLKEYEQVVEWLTDNEGRGLLLYGTCGRGKSLLGRLVIPAILLKYCRKIVSVYDVAEMNDNIDAVLSKHIISLDDIGTEEVSVKYGLRRIAFAEILDMTEKKSKLLIISTNLGEESIKERYGERILSRVKATTKRVLFQGKDLRK